MATNSNPQNVSDFKLKFSYWYVTNQPKLKKLLVIFLILLSAGLFGYSLYGAVLNLFIQQPSYQQSMTQLAGNLIDYNSFHQKNQPSALQITDFEAIAGNDNQSDFIIKLENQNKQWIARKVMVELLNGDQVVAQKTTFVYPQESKYLVFFNVKDGANLAARARIAGINWQRELNFSEFAKPRLEFAVSNIEFKSAGELDIKGELPISSLKFKIKNNTAYSYWQVGVYMILMGSQNIGGANYITLENFSSGEQREVEMRWYQPLPPIYETLILPEVDIFNPASYMPVK